MVLRPGSEEDGAAVLLAKRPLDEISPWRLALSSGGGGTTASASAADFLGAGTVSIKICVTRLLFTGRMIRINDIAVGLVDV
jgi:energy-converting hydrogenase Eha subunit C